MENTKSKKGLVWTVVVLVIVIIGVYYLFTQKGFSTPNSEAVMTQTSTLVVPAGYLDYISDHYGFQIAYPQEWGWAQKKNDGLSVNLGNFVTIDVITPDDIAHGAAPVGKWIGLPNKRMITIDGVEATIASSTQVGTVLEIPLTGYPESALRLSMSNFDQHTFDQILGSIRLDKNINQKVSVTGKVIAWGKGIDSVGGEILLQSTDSVIEVSIGNAYHSAYSQIINGLKLGQVLTVNGTLMGYNNFADRNYNASVQSISQVQELIPDSIVAADHITNQIPAGWQTYSFPQHGFAFNYYKDATVHDGLNEEDIQKDSYLRGVLILNATTSATAANTEPVSMLTVSETDSCYVDTTTGQTATMTTIDGITFQKTDLTNVYSGMNSFRYVKSYCTDHAGRKFTVEVQVWPKDRSDSEKQKAFQEIDDFMNKLDFTFTN